MGNDNLKIAIGSLSILVLFLLGYAGYLYLGAQYPTAISKTDILNENNNLINHKNMQKIRRPAVAGSFYPENPDELSKKIDGFLSNASIKSEGEIRMPKIILVPHAGYDYSGPVAAYGYANVRNYVQQKNAVPIKTVIILASSHNYMVRGIIADDNDSWETPLGKVDLDQELINKLGIKKDPAPFVPEHSLEVQLPFLQKILPLGFKIVPLLVGDEGLSEIQRAANQIARVIDENTLVIISSDMSHYPSYDDANQADQKVIDSVLTGDIAKFDDTINKLEKKNIPNAATFMCAKPAVELGLVLAKDLGIKDIQLLKHANSGDVTDDKSRVVGYAAVSFLDNPTGSSDVPGIDSKSVAAPDVHLQKSEKQELLKIARDSVESFIKNGTVPKFDKFTRYNQKSGAFVTLNTNGQLRGCIGLMESDQPLYQTVSQMAVAAATQDNRFYPVSAEELPKIEYEISVLSPMQKVSNPSEIKLGTHGVKVEKDGRSGVFLPQVAKETGWSLDEFMSHLCQEKAGLPADCWKDQATKIYVFTAKVFSE